MLGFLGSLLAGPLVKAGSWLLGKVGGAVKSIGSSIFGNSTIKKAASIIGPTITNNINKDSFDNSMRQFGNTVQNKMENSVLKPVLNGQNIGEAFYRGMNAIYSFMKSGGQTTGMVDSQGQPMAGVEKNNQQQDYQQQQQQNNNDDQ